MKVLTTMSIVLGLITLPVISACTPQERAQLLDRLGLNAGPAGNNNPGAGDNLAPNGGDNNNPAVGNNENVDNTPLGAGRMFENVPEKRIRVLLMGMGPEHGNAEYREIGTRRKLNVELEDAVPGSSHTILVDGVNIGELLIGPLGNAEVEFDTNVEPDHLPWPDELPTRLGPGVVIQVGNTSGTLGN